MMRRPARLAVAAVALAAGVLLAGCTSPPSVADRVQRGFPDSLTEEERAQMPWERLSVVWLEDGERFGLITWGSSSCHAMVTGIEAPSDAEVLLSVAPPDGAGPCTADMAATSHELTLPDGVTGRPITVTLTWAGSDETTQLTLD